MPVCESPASEPVEGVDTVRFEATGAPSLRDRSEPSEPGNAGSGDRASGQPGRVSGSSPSGWRTSLSRRLSESKIPLALGAIGGVLCLAVYLWAAQRTGFFARISRFDTVMTLDMAQIAVNTSRGDWLETRYLTPASLAIVPRVDAHPDMIRYPFPIHVYAVLSLLFSNLAAAIKALNGVLYLLNAYLVMRLAAAWIRREWEGVSRAALWGGAAVVAVLSSVANFAYLRLVVSDAYEVMATTLLLGSLWVIQARKGTGWVGLLAALLYLTRPNLSVLAPALILLSAYQGKDWWDRLRRAGWGITTTALPILPIVVRNARETGGVLLSLQSRVELAKDIVGAHEAIYRSFAAPPSVGEILLEHGAELGDKMAEGVGIGLSYLASAPYLAVGPACLLALLVLRHARPMVAVLSIMAVLHLVVVSAYLQLERAYAPLYFVLLAFGWSALLVLVGRVREVAQRKWASWSGAMTLAIWGAVPVVVVALLGAQWDELRVERDRRTRPPSRAAVTALERRGVECTYSNVPFWIPWVSPTTAVYAPLNLRELRKVNFEPCGFFLYDTRQKIAARRLRYLETIATRIDRGRGFELYRLED